MVRPAAEVSFIEPESNFSVGRFDCVRAVADVAANINAEVTTDGAWVGVKRLSGTEHFTASSYSVCTFPDHGADRASDHVINKTTEEALGGQVSVVLFHVRSSWCTKLHGDELESLLFEALNDCTNKSSLDSVGLDHNESSLHRCFNHCACVCENEN